MTDIPQTPTEKKKQEKHDKIVAFVNVTAVFLLVFGVVVIPPIVEWAAGLKDALDVKIKGRKH